jgi:hypothetical protein
MVGHGGVCEVHLWDSGMGAKIPWMGESGRRAFHWPDEGKSCGSRVSGQIADAFDFQWVGLRFMI